MSNGGGFVNTLACSPNGSDFAAFAPVAGAFYGDVDSSSYECKPSRTFLPVFEIHGQNDSIIPYEGGPTFGTTIPAIPDWLKRWAVRNGCSSSRSNTTRELVGGHVQWVSYSCEGVDDIVSGLLVRGLDHYWPSKEPNLDSQGHSTWIDATPYILNFFNAHRKPR